MGVLEEVFQIPTQIFFILRRETECECGSGLARGAVAGEIEFDLVTALWQGGLPETELEHDGVYPVS